MDDDLLADDGQFKDDGLDDLDIDEENALLGLSDDETQDGRVGNDLQELEYVDEDGNVVDMGENNAQLYEVANIRSKKKSYRSSQSHVDDDVLELDLDMEESFSQEDPDFSRSIESTSKFSSKKDNLISIHRRPESDKHSLSRSDSHHSDRDYERVKNENSYISHSSRNENRNKYLDLEFDEESEDENVDDDHRERFKSERSNIITLTPITKNRDIPDTLESVISVEESARVQEFLDNEQKRKLRWRNKGSFRGKGPMYQQQQYQQHRQQPQHQLHQQLQQPHQQQHQQQLQQQHQLQQQQQQIQQQQQLQQQLQQQQQQQQLQQQQQQQQQLQQQQQQPAQQQQPVVSRKILINPHFKGGPRLPPVSSTTQPQVLYPSQLVNVASAAPVTTYSTPTTTYQPPVYTHQEASHQVPLSTTNYSAPPPTAPYTHPDYPPPQQHNPQIPPPVWPSTTPTLSGHQYSDTLSVPTYLDPQVQNPAYANSYAPQNYQNTYQAPPPHIPPPHTTYQTHQPPPHLQHQPPNYAPPPTMDMAPNQYMHTSPPMVQHNVPRGGNSQRPRFQGQKNTIHQHQASQIARNRYNSPQRFQRQAEKRTGNQNIRSVPMKQPRIEHPQRKTNFHVNNANIREIPLIDTFSQTKKPTKKPAVPEEEDEKTKELRMKIEEQKLLREQILKRKEERRRQMAAQRMQELQKRKILQKNAAPANQNTTEPEMKGNPPTQAANLKPTVKERIGAPTAQPMEQVQGKKKVIVVRKKPQQESNLVAAPAKASGPQKVGAQNANQPQNSNKIGANQIEVKQNTVSGNVTKTPIKAPTQSSSQAPLAKNNANQGAALPVKDAAEKKVEPNKPIEQKRKLVISNTPNKKKIITAPKSRMRFPPRSPNSPQQRMSMQRFHSQRNSEPMFRGPRFHDNRIGSPMKGMRMPHPNDMRMPHPNDMRMPHPNDMRMPHPNDMRMPHPNNMRMPHPNDMRMPHPNDMRMPHPNDMRMPHPNDMRMPHPHFQDHRHPPPMPLNHREPLLIHPREPMMHHPFYPPDGPHPLSPQRFRMQGPPGPGFPNFRPRGDMFPDCFPPRFQNQMPHMFEQGNPGMFSRPPFQGPNIRHRSPIRLQSANRQQNATNKNAKAQTPKVKEAVQSGDLKSEGDIPENDGKPVAIEPKGSGDSKGTDNQNIKVQKNQTVMVKNLSSSTSEEQLKELCATVGQVNNIELVKNERKAIIIFKEPIQATNFQKKYQRYMLDLAMIQVSLLSS